MRGRPDAECCVRGGCWVGGQGRGMLCGAVQSVSRWNAIRHFLTNSSQTYCADALNATTSLSRLFVIDSVPHNDHTSSEHFDFKALPLRCTAMPTPSPLKRPSGPHVRSPSHTHVSRITRMLPYLPRRLLHPRPSPHASPSYLSTVRLRALAHHPFACYTYTVRTLSLSHTQRLSHHSHATHTHTCARTISLVLLTLPPHTLYPQHTAAARRIEVVKRAIGAGSTLATT